MPSLAGGPTSALAQPEPAGAPAPFHSILFDRPLREADVDQCRDPGFFADLNLDQLFTSIAEERAGYRARRQDARPGFVRPGEAVEEPDPYHLRPFFCAPLEDVEAIAYRHDVMRDLEVAALRDEIRSFAQSMRAMRDHLARVQKLHYHYQKAGWFLDAVEIYCDAVAVWPPRYPIWAPRRAAFEASPRTSWPTSDPARSGRW
jgi:DNA mismatch repair protein MutS